MTAYQSPFQFGTLATNDNFIDRVEDRALLKQLLSSHINVMLISPRRWGKSSLVKKAMSELADEDKNVRVCYIDAFSIGSEAEFYRTFASQVIACASSKMERWMEDAKKFVPQERDKMTILQLPEMLAKEKGIKIIVCIDEFQQGHGRKNALRMAAATAHLLLSLRQQAKYDAQHLQQCQQSFLSLRTSDIHAEDSQETLDSIHPTIV